jgi:hypothetical protein
MKNLTLHLKELVKEHTKPQISRMKKITTIREEINEIENRKMTGKNKTKQELVF